MDCDLSIIIVSWNVWHLLSACLRSIEQISQTTVDTNLRSFGPPALSSTLEVIVVDNASSDPTLEQLPRSFPWVTLIRSETNLGFTKGNNLAVQHSRGQMLFFLNPDTEITVSPVRSAHQPQHAQDSLWALYDAVRNDETVGMAGPQLRYADGTWQNSRRRFPSPLTGFFESTWLAQAWPSNPWARAMHMSDWPATQRHDVDWITGAAMMMKRVALTSTPINSATGNTTTMRETMREAEERIFDERFFMYSEELDLCKRIRDRGWRIVYVPESVIIHYEGKSSEQVVANRHIHFNTSKVRYWHKWFGPRWGEALRRYLLLEYRWQLASEWIKAVLGHKRELRKGRISVYREVIENGLH